MSIYDGQNPDAKLYFPKPLDTNFELTLYGKHYDRVYRLWERVCLGAKLRERWCRRRHRVPYRDMMYQSLLNQCHAFYNLLDWLVSKGVYS